MEGQDWKVAASRAMDRYAEGDDAAFSVVYDLMAPALYGFFVRRARCRHDAQDLLHETFMKMCGARAHFDEGGDVTPWAYAIARNVWIDFQRKRRKTSWVEAEARTKANEEDAAPTSEQLLDGRQLGVRIERELSKLPDKYREAFMLVMVDDLAIRDAAAVVGCTETAMKLRAHRSYEALRVALGDEAVSRFGGRT